MVWSEKTSNEFKEQGVMGTHDMETYNFFKNTKVCCALAPRELEVNEFTDLLQNEFASGMYTHHQKAVILDAPSRKADSDKRRLIAFVGGLDLTGGRWDTPDHPFYDTLLNEHLDDFRNSNAKSVPPEEGKADYAKPFKEQGKICLASLSFCKSPAWLSQFGQSSLNVIFFLQIKSLFIFSVLTGFDEFFSVFPVQRFDKVY